MKEHTEKFLEVAFEYGALKLGRFVLKSKRASPYFFNMKEICSGKAVKVVADCYAQVLCAEDFITEESLPVLFGPAYGAISIVTAITLSLLEYGENASFASSRKKEKDHGELGFHIGKSLDACEVVIIDDVASGGGTICDTIKFVQDSGGFPRGVVVGLDRQEREVGNGQSVIQRLQRELNIRIRSVATLSDMCEFVQNHSLYGCYFSALDKYRREFCIVQQV